LLQHVENCGKPPSNTKIPLLELEVGGGLGPDDQGKRELVADERAGNVYAATNLPRG